MKKIIIVLIAICFLAGCVVEINDTDYCHNCHRNRCGNTEIERQYRTNICANCHKPDRCEQGSEWKERELAKQKSKPKRTKKKRR